MAIGLLGDDVLTVRGWRSSVESGAPLRPKPGGAEMGVVLGNTIGVVVSGTVSTVALVGWAEVVNVAVDGESGRGGTGSWDSGVGLSSPSSSLVDSEERKSWVIIYIADYYFLYLCYGIQFIITHVS